MQVPTVGDVVPALNTHIPSPSVPPALQAALVV